MLTPNWLDSRDIGGPKPWPIICYAFSMIAHDESMGWSTHFPFNGDGLQSRRARHALDAEPEDQGRTGSRVRFAHAEVFRPGRLQSLMVLDRCWSAEPEEGQWPLEGAEGHLAESGGDVDVAGGAELVDGEAAEGGHVFRPVSGADLGGILAEGGVPHKVEPVFNHPL